MRCAVLLSLLLQQQAPDDKAVEEALERFKTSYKDQSIEARASAVGVLAFTRHKRILGKVAPFLVSDGPEVRIAAAKGIGGFKGFKEAAPLLIGALAPNEKELDVGCAILGALGELAEDACYPTLHKYFRERNIKLAKAAVAGAGAAKSRHSMDPLIALLKDTTKWIQNKQSGGYTDQNGQQGDENACRTRLQDFQKDIIKAFQTITGEKWTTAQEWEHWWNKNKATFQVTKKEEKK
jgi:hypothetical protein